MNDRELPLDGVRPRADGGPDLGYENLEGLFKAAKEITDDIAEQAAIVTLCVSAGWDANRLRRRAMIGGVIPHWPPRAVEVVRHHPRSRPLKRERRGVIG